MDMCAIFEGLLEVAGETGGMALSASTFCMRTRHAIILRVNCRCDLECGSNTPLNQKYQLVLVRIVLRLVSCGVSHDKVRGCGWWCGRHDAVA